MKWFQNHSYSDKKTTSKKSGRKKSLSHSSENPSSDDDEAVEAHLSELTKEMKREKHDKDKVTRLLSLTFSSIADM